MKIRQNYENENRQLEVVDKDDFSKKSWDIVKKNPVTFFLLIILIAFVGWSTIRMSIYKKQFKKERAELIAKYEFETERLKLKSLMFSSKVFSWSVRSELIRENFGNLNQLFNVYAKESGADLAQLISLKNKKIIISTDKKFQGDKFILPASVNLSQQFTASSGSITTIYTPIIGYTNDNALLVVSVSIIKK